MLLAEAYENARAAEAARAPKPKAEPEPAQVSVPRLATVEDAPAAGKPPVRDNGRDAGRVSRALSLIGEGVRTLFGRS